MTVHRSEQTPTIPASPTPASVRPAQSAVGLAFGLVAFGLWGAFPLYIDALQPSSANEILAHRVAWAGVLLLLLALVRSRVPSLLGALTDTRTLVLLSISTVLIAVNWWTYTWAVNAGHVLQASLGYYLNPLINIGLGFVFLRERLRPCQWASVTLAVLGVGFLVYRMLATTLAGQHTAVETSPYLVVFIPLILAFSFASYGLIRKIAAVDSITGLTLETLLLTPLCFTYIFRIHGSSESTFLVGDALRLHDWLLIAGGVVTAVPLLCFTSAARRLRLATLGMIQYIAPTGQFLLAVLHFDEKVTGAHKFAFTCIWIAITLYTIDSWGAIRRSRSAAQPQ